ncbi:gamma-glutamylcyclotransferase [Pseudooceanicola sp. CBS1P-1]|uniref:Gamma-glutamylcyclotransferase n=1 Tax=Pseudooceanicola albus TaxID=2692189 RepID=A0A6L7G1Z0_9RHOB|nr:MULTISPECIES: gamma-glutamylcyclotransferase family protein [Pseudooceanicola]MBT9384683.1 gamma-glutamylcyclotransferase [Pseudooceanicola endophyticus]MXN18384.1 gamma-glutamylcyclotransferase [Pseudooceanicola albus]
MTQDPYFFGYGSLVNRRTHDYARARPARAQGWRRLWRHIAGRDTAILTAIPAPGTQIEGLIAAVPGADWAALDLREAFYDRLPATDAVRHDLAPGPQVAIYSIPATKHPAAPAPAAILLSYLDVVVQGYRDEFGEAGVARFFDTTDGWDAPILNDRAAPLYPRAQSLTAAETALVDHHLTRLGAHPA